MFWNSVFCFHFPLILPLERVCSTVFSLFFTCGLCTYLCVSSSHYVSIICRHVSWCEEVVRNRVERRDETRRVSSFFCWLCRLFRYGFGTNHLGRSGSICKSDAWVILAVSDPPWMFVDKNVPISQQIFGEIKVNSTIFVYNTNKTIHLFLFYFQVPTAILWYHGNHRAL